MKLLLDQGLPRGAVSLLMAVGFEATHVGDVGMAAASDEEILTEGVRRGAIVVTLDADFHALMATGARVAPSVVRLRVEGLDATRAAQFVTRIVGAATEALRTGALVTATDTVVRIQMLPIA